MLEKVLDVHGRWVLRHRLTALLDGHHLVYRGDDWWGGVVAAHLLCAPDGVRADPGGAGAGRIALGIWHHGVSWWLCWDGWFVCGANGWRVRLLWWGLVLW